EQQAEAARRSFEHLARLGSDLRADVIAGDERDAIALRGVILHRRRCGGRLHGCATAPAAGMEEYRADRRRPAAAAARAVPRGWGRAAAPACRGAHPASRW